MFRLFPQPPAYAEDQPLSHTILTWHVLSRGFALGSGFGSLTYLVRRYILKPNPSLSLLRSSGTGSLVGTGLLTLALLGRMRGRDEIEWKDRSWRLLWNRGQREVDDFWLGGLVLGGGVVAVAARGGAETGRGKGGGGGKGVWTVVQRGVRGTGWKGVVGGMGLGALGGMLVQSGWRYGVRGGFGEERLDGSVV
ncbi:hypothetical protein GE09DRAFT_1243229 [Coniochaeta sp. 2T2.1]|nr:hypothetical protein GE09DRAFT_1243229 [Coniochaeta sp. 2T2.1]